MDRFVADVSGLSRSYVQKLITEGHVTAGRHAGQGQRVRRSRRDSSTLEIPDPVKLELEPEDDPALGRLRGRRLLIVDKPPASSSIPRPATRAERS